jgi:hypothetical protein
MKALKFLIPVSFFALGVMAGGVFLSRSEKTAAEVEKESSEKSSALPDKGLEASNRALRSRIRELEDKLAKLSDGEKKPEESKAVKAADRPSPHERMKRLEKENPALYAQITNRVARWREHRAKIAREKSEFLSSIDISGFDDGARATHSRLQELTLYREEIEEKMHSRDIADADRRDLFAKMRECDRELAELNRVERENLLSEMAKNLGFGKEEAREIGETVKEIIDATEMHRGFRPRRTPR